MEIIRDYRLSLKGYNVTVKETDLWIYSEKILKDEAAALVFRYRNILERYIEKNPHFFTTLKPLPVLEDDPDIVLEMKRAALVADVGPFASVAGVISEFVAQDLKKFSEEVIVENGGDIFAIGKRKKIVKIFSKNNVNLGLKIEKELLPISVCSSSGKIGHSFSKGRADLVTVVAKKGAVADAFATAICNKIKKEKDIDNVVTYYSKNNLILGCLIFFNGKIAGWGNLNLIKIEE